MPSFDQYIARHGEYGVQAIIERLERYEGIRSGAEFPLEIRWTVVMCEGSFQQRLTA